MSGHELEKCEGEETLQMLAKLPAPEGLSGRVHSRLAGERLEVRRNWWQLSVPQMRFAAAAVLLVALAGEGWNLYRGHVAEVRSVVAPPHVTPRGGFDNAHGAAVPKTLTPIHVPPAPKKKAGKIAPQAKATAPAEKP
jgi:hypothetical protein